MTYVKNKSIILLHLKLMIVAIDECKTKTDAAECEASTNAFVFQMMLFYHALHFHRTV